MQLSWGDEDNKSVFYKIARCYRKIIWTIKEEFGLIGYPYSPDIPHLDKTKYPFRYVLTSSVLIDGDTIGGYINHEHIQSEIELYGNNIDEILSLVKSRLSLEIQEFEDESPTIGKRIKEIIPIRITTC